MIFSPRKCHHMFLEGHTQTDTKVGMKLKLKVVETKNHQVNLKNNLKFNIVINILCRKTAQKLIPLSRKNIYFHMTK